MRVLKNKMDPVEFQKFTEGGFFTARRTEKTFGGIHSNQTIEKTLMKSMKVVGGPFKRGATDSVVFKWIKVVISCNDVIEGIEKFCNAYFQKSFQHSDESYVRANRDKDDVKILKEWLDSHSPFSEMDEIMSIATEEGMALMKRMNGQNMEDLKLKRNDRVLSLLSVNSKIKLNDKEVPIDKLLIFQRICIIKKSDEELKEYLKYELAPFPLALFDESGMPKTQKSALYNTFDECEMSLKDNYFYYVVDGGMLLHQVKWHFKEKFITLCDQYIRYIIRNYRENVAIVFDGYDDITIKKVERNRRARKNASVDVIFTEEMKLKTSHEKFLSNRKKKSRFISLLRQKLSAKNIVNYQATGDADRLIVETAIGLIDPNVVIVFEDVDILVLVTALSSNKEIHFLKPSHVKSSKNFFLPKLNCETILTIKNIYSFFTP